MEFFIKGEIKLENKKSLLIGIIILTCGVVFSSLWLGYSMQKSSSLIIKEEASNSNVFTLSEVADYIGISKEEVLGLIDTEKNILEETGTFTGRMFPYFTVNEKQYFYKDEVDEWLKDVSNEHREYDTNKKTLIQ